MADPSKINPKWNYSKYVVGKIAELAQIKNASQEGTAEIMLVKQLANEFEVMTEFERVEWEKKGVIFDVQAICETQNVTVKGNVEQVFVSAVALSDQFLTRFDGKEVEKSYLFALYTRLDELKRISMDDYFKIVAVIKKNRRKYNIYKKYCAIWVE